MRRNVLYLLLGRALTLVSGLLTGQDVAQGLTGRDLGDAVFAPKAMFDSRGRVTLDGVTAGDLEDMLGVPVVVADGIKTLLDYFAGNGYTCH